MTAFSLRLGAKNYSFTVVDSHLDFSNLPLSFQKQVNILASGASIKQVDFAKISQQPCIFVNGSIELIQHHDFSQATGYVITDSRFIRHNLAILQRCYQAQCPLFITQSVLFELAEKCPEFLTQFYPHIYLIFAVDRPILATKKVGFLGKIFSHKLKLSDFSQSSFHRIKPTQTVDIGVSLDIRHGFVEAGTVAYVATQLAFSLGFRQIYLYGVDLINASEPRFYENTQNAAPSKLEPAIYNRIVPSFDLLAKTYAEQGVSVINTSPISKDLFQYLPFNPL